MLADDRDRVRLRDGAARLFALARHPAVAGIAEAITLGGTAGASIETVADPAALDAWLDATVFDTYHPAGTCRMGAADDPCVIVDSACRVIGVDGLRVIDASIMPEIPRANLHLTCVMIGERMAERLRNGFTTWHGSCTSVSMNVHDLVSDELWTTIAPLLPPQRPHPKGGRPWLPDRPALCGILYVLKTGIQWRRLPQDLGCGSGVTCWRRLRDWQAAGVWQALHRVLLDRLGAAGRIDWSRASVDSASVRAKGGARRPARTRPTAPNPAPSTTSPSTATASRLPAA